MKLISFSLWGNLPKYVTGALRNAELAPAHYPGWRCRFHCGASVPRDAVDRLRAFPHVEIVEHQEAGDWSSMFWRFADAGGPAADAVIVRDTDSRLDARERAAVDQWLSGGHPFHIMRDHPEHNRPILGGMWGARAGVLPDMPSLIEQVPKLDHIQVDQDFLETVICPRVASQALVHDEYYGGRPFPTARVGRAFVGQPYDENDRPLIEGPTAFDRWIRQTVRRLGNAVGLAQLPQRLTP